MIQRLLIPYTDDNKIIERKRAEWVISRYLKVIPGVKKEVIKDLIDMRLLKRIDRYKLQIINEELCLQLDPTYFLKSWKAKNSYGKR